MFWLGFTIPRGHCVGYLRQFLIFRPQISDGQSRARGLEAFAHYLDENRKPQPIIAHQSPPFSRLPPLNLRPARVRKTAGTPLAVNFFRAFRLPGLKVGSLGGPQIKGGVKRGDAGVWWIPVFLDLAPFPAREWCKRPRAQCPDTKAGATIQKYSAALPGIQFDAARYTNLQPWVKMTSRTS
jgi:hypothetical protein